MRVLHIIPSISPLRGGPSQAIMSMVGSLRDQSVDARILTTNDHGSEIQKSMPLGSWHTRIEGGQEIPVLAFARWNPPIRALREFCVSNSFIDWITEHSNEYDLVHVHALFSYTSSMAMAKLRRTGKPYILRTIGQLNSWSMTQSRIKKQMFLSLVDRANILGATALHFTSDFEQSESTQISGNTYSFVLPLGVNEIHTDESAWTSSSMKEQKSETRRLLFLSRLHPKKQLPLLFSALQQLKKDNPDKSWQLDIAGEGDPLYLESLQELSKSLGISEHVVWHGHVTGSTKLLLLKQADWFVLPSLSENFGISVVEALKSGTPAVLTPGVAVAADVERFGAGYVCQPTIEGLSVCLERCLDPPDSKMKSAAKKLAEERYSWASISKQLIIEYERAIHA